MLFDAFAAFLHWLNEWLVYLLGLKVLFPRKSLDNAESLMGRLLIVLAIIAGIVIGILALINAW